MTSVQPQLRFSARPQRWEGSALMRVGIRSAAQKAFPALRPRPGDRGSEPSLRCARRVRSLPRLAGCRKVPGLLGRTGPAVSFARWASEKVGGVYR